MFDLDAVKNRLLSFGYTVTDIDDFAINFCMEKVRTSIQNNINQADVPEGLEFIAVDMTVGEFLLSKKTFSPTDLTNFNLDAAIKQIQLGDTTFSIGSGNLTPEQRLDSFINYLIAFGENEFTAYRTLRW